MKKYFLVFLILLAFTANAQEREKVSLELPQDFDVKFVLNHFGIMSKLCGRGLKMLVSTKM
ncbi:MAG: hypothetical protein IPJ69_04305 [Deltaproteobacteria bacterium]|nr:MAG: hypothetical protein IPJ69_04305 [Deltaproteobacteria bacterium]